MYSNIIPLGCFLSVSQHFAGFLNQVFHQDTSSFTYWKLMLPLFEMAAPGPKYADLLPTTSLHGVFGRSFKTSQDAWKRFEIHRWMSVYQINACKDISLYKHINICIYKSMCFKHLDLSLLHTYHILMVIHKYMITIYHIATLETPEIRQITV